MQRPFVSSKVVILKIVRDLNLGNMEIPWQDLIEWIGEGLQHIGAYGQLVEKQVDLLVEGYRAKLPEDFFSVRPSAILNAKIMGDNLMVGFETGTLSGFSYLSFPLDCEGFPLVPDHISYHTALFWKVAMQLAIRGELQNKELSFATCKGRWDWYCRQAGSAGQYSPGMAQRFASFFTSRIPVLTNAEQDFNEVNGAIQAVNENPMPLPRTIPQHFYPKPQA